LLIKYIKSVLWRVAKCLSYIEEARCLKVNAVGQTDGCLLCRYTECRMDGTCSKQHLDFGGCSECVLPTLNLSSTSSI